MPLCTCGHERADHTHWGDPDALRRAAEYVERAGKL